MTYRERAKKFFEKYAPELAANVYAVDVLASQFEEVAREQRGRDLEMLAAAEVGDKAAKVGGGQ
jgi:hypothetical protein